MKETPDIYGRIKGNPCSNCGGIEYPHFCPECPVHGIPQSPTGWEEQIRELMFERLYHEDLITNEKRVTLKGQTLINTVRALITQTREATMERIVKLRKEYKVATDEGVSMDNWIKSGYNNAIDDILQLLTPENTSDNKA